MKKLITTTAITMSLALGALAQGSLHGMTNWLFQSDGITTPGPNATNPDSATTWYYGNVSLNIYYAPLGNVTASQIANINNLDGIGFGAGVAALDLLISDGFTLVSSTNGSTAGPIAYTCFDGYLTGGPDTIDLLSPTPTYGSGWLAMVAYVPGDENAAGVLAWSQANVGGNRYAKPIPGFPYWIEQNPAGLNLVLEVVPEPGTLGFLALGSGSLFVFRRR